MGWIIWCGILPACFAAAWVICRPLRQMLEDANADHARALFRRQREWLEARFLGALSKVEPAERLRWEDARWHDPVHWARDRRTRRLLALVAVSFEPDLSAIDGPARHATALFEFRDGRWHADGKHIDALRPDEAFLGNRRFEPAPPGRHG